MSRLSKAMTVAALFAATAATAQEGGTRLTFGVSTTARADDNWQLLDESDEVSTQAISTLTAGIFSETRTMRAGLRAGGSLHATNIGSEDTESGFIDPFARAEFAVTGPSSMLSLGAGIAETDRSVGRTSDAGVRTDIDANFGYQFGIDRPLGGDLNLDYDRNLYDEAAGDNDEETLSGAIDFHVAVTPKVILRPGASAKVYREEDGADREVTTDTLSLGITAELSEVDRLDARIARKTIDDSAADVTEGTAWSLSYTRESVSGTTVFSISRDISTNGERTEAAFERLVAVSDGTLEYGIGVAETASDAHEVTGRLNWSQTLPLAQVSINLVRAVITDDDGTESTDTTLSGAYQMDLSEISRLALRGSYSAEDTVGETASEDASLSLSYGLTIADDWQLWAGAEVRAERDEGEDIRSSNSIFVTLEREWVMFP